MEQEQRQEMTKDQMILELIALLKKNQQKEAANHIYEMAALLDGMEKKLDLVTEELSSVRSSLEKLEQEKADKTMKAVIKKSVESLEQQCNKMKEHLFEVKAEVKGKAAEIVAEAKQKGKAALNRVSEFLGIKEKLVSVRDNMQKSIGKTEQTIVKIDALGSGIREAGQKAANAFRSFADKDTVDYAAKEKKFSKTELAKQPFVVQKKMYRSMEKHLDAVIDRIDSLARQSEQIKKKQDPEPAIFGMVTEPECVYGAEAFEAYQQTVKGQTDTTVSHIPEAKNKRR